MPIKDFLFPYQFEELRKATLAYNRERRLKGDDAYDADDMLAAMVNYFLMPRDGAPIERFLLSLRANHAQLDIIESIDPKELGLA